MHPVFFKFPTYGAKEGHCQNVHELRHVTELHMQVGWEIVY